MASAEFTIEASGLDALLQRIEALEKAGVAASQKVADGISKVDDAARATAAGMEAVTDATEETAHKASEIEKLLQKQLTGDLVASIFERVSSSLGQLDDGYSKFAGNVAKYSGQLVQGFTQAGAAGVGMAALGIVANEVALAFGAESEKAKQAQAAIVEHNAKAIESYKQLGDELRQLRVQEAALSIQRQMNLTQGVALAQAGIEDVNKQREQAVTRRRQADEEVRRLEAQIADAQKRANEANAARVGSRAEFSSGRESQLQQQVAGLVAARDAAKSRADAEQDVVTRLETQSRLLTQQKETTQTLETAAALRAQSEAYRESLKAASALTIQQRTGASGAYAAASAQIAWLTAAKDLPPELQNDEVRTKALKAANQQLANVIRGELIAAIEANKTATLQAAVAREAFNLQTEQGIAATVAQARAELDYFNAHESEFGKFVTDKQRDEERKRRELALDAALNAERQKTTQLIRDEANAAAARASVAGLTGAGFSNEYAQAANALMEFRQQREAFLGSGSTEEQFYQREAQLLARLTEIRETEAQVAIAAREATAQAVLDAFQEESRAALSALQVQDLVRAGYSQDVAAVAVSLQKAEAAEAEARANLDKAASLGDVIELTALQKELDVASLEVIRQRIALRNAERDGAAARSGADGVDAAAAFGNLGPLAEAVGLIERGESGAMRLAEGAGLAGGAFLALGSTAQAAGQIISQSLSEQIGQFATYSRAQEQLAALQGLTAEETQAAEAAKTQATLASIAQTAAIQAVEQSALALAAAASQKWDSAALHAAAALTFGSIAGVSAAAGNSIGQNRGNTREENEALERARNGGSSGRGGSGRGTDKGGPQTIVVNVGQGILASQPDLERSIAKANKEFERRN